MNKDLLDELAEIDVPPLPADLPQGVHKRVNDQLLLAHIADFALRCLPQAMFYFGRALVGACYFSLTGSHYDKGDNHAD